MHTVPQLHYDYQCHDCHVDTLAVKDSHWGMALSAQYITGVVKFIANTKLVMGYIVMLAYLQISIKPLGFIDMIFSVSFI